MPLETFAWPLSELDEAVELLGRRVGHPAGAAPRMTTLMGADATDPAALGRALERLVEPHGLEVEECTLRYGAVNEMAAPLIVRLPGDDARFLVIARRRGAVMVALDRMRRWRRLHTRVCADALRSAAVTGDERDLENLLDAAAVDPRRRPGVLQALLHEQLADVAVADAWQFVHEPGGDFRRLLQRTGVAREAAALVGLHAAQFSLWLLSWALIGRGALDGHIDWGWLTAWVLLLATVVPLQIWATRKQGVLALSLGRLLKQRLLAGALRLDSEVTRHQGAGALLGRVLESDAVESLAVSGGLQAGLALIELLLAATVLWLGAAGGALVILLAAVTLATAFVCSAYYRRRAEWSSARLNMTNELVEKVAGHRTRLAQEHPARWHDEEDRSLEDYLARSSALDRWTPALLVAIPRGWLALGIGVLAPEFVDGTPAAALAISLGGVLLVSLALRRFADGLAQLSGAAIAWGEARPLFAAAAARPASPVFSEAASPLRPAAGALEVRDVTFQYPSRTAPVLAGCSLRAAAGDRLLIEGSSGGGKSTFGSIIAGLRLPGSGLVLVDGLDRRTLGAEGWRRRVVAAPQFHENHVFCETFAFNLLMGRRWPPTDADLDEAEAVARELGLGDLLGRMPAGLMQLVGEGGWQLSHGERGRVFMARALLQGAGVMILDESFAALDPATLQQTLECVLRRAPTLMVIAHP